MNTPCFNPAIAETDLNALAITVGSNVTEPTAIQPYNLGEWLEATKTGKVKYAGKDITKIVESIRKEADKDKRNKLKMNLPYVCGAVIHTKRASENVTSNSVMIFDLDKVKDIEAMKNAAMKISYVYAAFRSPYDGVKLIVPLATPITDVDTYKNIYAKINADITTKLEHPCDNTNDPARACFLSHDPDLIVNDAVIPVDIEQMMDSYQTTKLQAESAKTNPDSPQLSQKRRKSPADYEKAKEVVQALCQIKLSHDDWIEAGMAIKAGFGEEGKALWDMFLTNPNFNDTQADLDAKWRSFKEDGGITLATLFHLAKQHNIPKGFQMNMLKPISPASIGDSDDDICKLFFAKYGHLHRYVPEHERWYQWEKSHWEAATTKGCSTPLHKDVHRFMNSLDDDSQKNIKKKLANQRTKEPVLRNMQSYPDFILNRADMDTHKDVLAMKNGVLVLTATGESSITDDAEMRKYNLSKCLPVDYDPAATCPKWEKFIQEIFSGDTELIEWLQLYMGAVFLAEPKDKIVIAWGEGANGKTTFFNVLQTLLGSYCAMIDPGMFIASKNSSGQSFDPPNLENSRLAIGNELKDHCYFAEDKLKRFTSKGHYPLHTKGKDIREIAITWSLILVTNKIPTMDFKSEAMKRRMVIIPFKQQFKGDKANQGLEDELKAELSGILNWILLGTTSYLSNNKNLPEPPESTRIAFNAYEQDSNPIMQFIKENCTVEPFNDLEFKNLYSCYTEWCVDNGQKPISKIALGKSIDGMIVDGVKLRKDKSTTYQNKTYIFGLSLSETDSSA